MLAASHDGETRAVCLMLKLLESFLRTSMADVEARLCWVQRSLSCSHGALAGADDSGRVGNGVMSRGQSGSLRDHSGDDSLARGPEGACRCSCYSEMQTEGFSKIVSMLERQTQVLLLLGIEARAPCFLFSRSFSGLS